MVHLHYFPFVGPGPAPSLPLLWCPGGLQAALASVVDGLAEDARQLLG
jgi:hypothetical protein